MLRRLGSGGMGVVYLGVDGAGQQVAIKLLRDEFGEDEAFRQRFRREVEAARRVSGVCTARYLDADIEGRQPFLVTQFLPGPNLAQAVEQDGPLSRDQLLALLAGLAEALIAIHGVGVIHRDLKPSNVILTPDGPRVIDFGIARAFEATSLTQTGALLGSPAWMAPEQAEGKPVTTATDVFALGATIAYAGMARSAFGEGSPQAVLYRVVHEQPTLSGLDPSVVETVAAALAKEPSRRPTPCAILQAAASQTIGPASSGAASSTTVAAILARTWHHEPGAPTAVGPSRRSRSRVLAPFVLAVAVAALLVGMALSGENSDVGDDDVPVSDGTTLDVATTPLPTSTSIPPPPSPDDPRSYYTTDGTRPVLAPDCNGLLGLCLGAPVERATALFGLENERHGAEGTIYRYWDVGPVHLSIASDEAGSVTSISGSIAEGDKKARLRLPDGLVLGEATMADVLRVKGTPFDTDTTEGENIIIYSYVYREGGEGHERVRFSVGAEAGSSQDPGGFNGALRARLVDTFEVGYWMGEG